MVEVPPPPENPFMNEPDANGNGEAMDSGTPDVAARPGRVLIVLGIVGSIIVFLLFSIFSGDEKKSGEKNKGEKRQVAAAPAEQLEPPPLPEAPALPAPPPPDLATPAIPEPSQIELLKPEEDNSAKEQALARMRSKTVLMDGGGGIGILNGDQDQNNEKKPINNNANVGFEANVVNSTTRAERVEATHIGEMYRTIAQGRIIHATLESTINTDLPAPIRAIVSRDTFAEAGTVAMIPKGSRLIGTYNTQIDGMQNRVYVIWTRVIRPDGVDIMINSPLVDQIGQAGIGGQVDSKFQSIFSRSVLSSVVGIGMAIGSDALSGGSATQAVGGGLGGGAQTTGDAATLATVNALNRLGGVSDNFIQRFIGQMQPTILVDQGSVVNVFVNRDLVFPEGTVPGAAKIVN